MNRQPLIDVLKRLIAAPVVQHEASCVIDYGDVDPPQSAEEEERAAEQLAILQHQVITAALAAIVAERLL